MGHVPSRFRRVSFHLRESERGQVDVGDSHDPIDRSGSPQANQL